MEDYLFILIIISCLVCPAFCIDENYEKGYSGLGGLLLGFFFSIFGVIAVYARESRWQRDYYKNLYNNMNKGTASPSSAAKPTYQDSTNRNQYSGSQSSGRQYNNSGSSSTGSSSGRQYNNSDNSSTARSSSGKWKCFKCGRINENYVRTCTCGNAKDFNKILRDASADTKIQPDNTSKNRSMENREIDINEFQNNEMQNIQKLRLLKEQLDKGLITQEEYDRKKKELLGL